MNRPSVPDFGGIILRTDGLFLAFTGILALCMETVGYFVGIGPLATLAGLPQTIGQVEAHGLATILGTLLLRSSSIGRRRTWHFVGFIAHALLGACNVASWPVFRQFDQVAVGWVTTTMH